MVYCRKPFLTRVHVTTYLEQLKLLRRALLPLLVAAIVAGVLAATTDGADAGPKANGLQHVTLIGDSVATALPIDDVALQTVADLRGAHVT